MKVVAAYHVPSTNKPFRLIIAKGSAASFSYPANPLKSAIVNAANNGCLGGGGVDGAISRAGGFNLLFDRSMLPLVAPNVRCKTGHAVITGPNNYGSLKTSFVIHAVGPNYRGCNENIGDMRLFRAYQSSLQRAQEAGLEAVAFSLLSAGSFCGMKTVKQVLMIGMQAIYTFHPYPELKEIHLIAFNDEEANALVEIASKLDLMPIYMLGSWSSLLPRWI